ncbi:MAG: hypothetical protein HN736_03590 [Anaerolineae bacterium]|jgi:hypothetical protein|nr:hypothetical protein [Anaerolineae bacterium]MBT4309911.1 hypothetical protein [Anaerolineae bacterium]MBT4460056.1 hypothetical protein [Anaerolineae bacterium]MBT4843661.1 hypothetical protein [Anaerolineae bacterium]MBT6060817.1 hypothetical protein [Anaerolineae bacterium]
MSLINHYSMLWGVAFLFGLFLFLFRKDDAKKKKLYAVTGVVVLLLAVWFTTRAQTGSKESALDLREEIGQGQPILLELQSPF